MAADITDQVNWFVDEVEAACEGRLFKGDGDYIVIDDMDEWKEKKYDEEKKKFLEEHPFTDEDDREQYGTEDEYVTDNIGDVDDVDEPDEVSIYDYLSENGYDLKYEVDGSLDLRGAKVLLAGGGPTVWLHDDKVCGYWGGDTCERSLSDSASRTLWEYFSEMWENAKSSIGGR